MPEKGKEIYVSDDQYFEGTLQLRDPTQEVIDFVEDLLGREKEPKLSKVLKVRNGFDFLLSDQRYLRALGKKLQEKFPGDLKYSRMLFTRNRQTSKEVFRVTVMFRPCGFGKGDIIQYKGEEMEVVSFGTRLTLKDPRTGKKKTVQFGDPYLS